MVGFEILLDLIFWCSNRLLIDICDVRTGRHDVGSLSKDGRHHSYARSSHSVHSHRSSSFTNLAYGM